MSRESPPPSDPAEELDPFELFDRATGADTCRNPYPELAEALRGCPIRKVDLATIAGEAARASAAGVELPEIYQALSHEAVNEVLDRVAGDRREAQVTELGQEPHAQRLLIGFVDAQEQQVAGVEPL